MTTPVVTNPPIHDLLTTITPMLADTSDIKLETLAGTHLFDTKVDGLRAIAAWDGSRLTMRNRNGRVMDNYLDLEVAAAGLPGPVILDGEIVAESGKFQDAAWRDKQRGVKAIKAMQDCPARFMAFDILWHPHKGDVRHLPYHNRRFLLTMLELEQHCGPRWSITQASTDPKFYDVIRALGGEGVIAKRYTARYEPGRRSSWLKYKAAYTLSCIGTGYEPGKGARAQFGALYLALIGKDGQAVPVGKVGSGFTLPETLEMKAILDKATAAFELPIVEIQTYNLTRDGKLRMPVYLGQRTDLTLKDCTVAQLEQLPTT
jgi:bifunctional non-homologous end joining protein LigD